MRIGIAGSRSTVALEFAKLMPGDCQVTIDRLVELPPDLDRYLICTGYLAGKSLSMISRFEAEQTFQRNFVEPARFCDRVFECHPSARVCLLGSESGFAGSHDMAYAGAKAALHLYVEKKRLRHAEQQLVAIAPTVIWDSGMTQRRDDLDALAARGAALRAGRWLTAAEVAKVAFHALLGATPFLSNTVIRLGAGER